MPRLPHPPEIAGARWWCQAAAESRRALGAESKTPPSRTGRTAAPWSERKGALLLRGFFIVLVLLGFALFLVRLHLTFGHENPPSAERGEDRTFARVSK
ncbi:hypothetical protein ATE48_03030 [Candidatus Viadribacter manganicus]|uniref:Uncharacterized protein n=1 Tax=Candidatus Viadribacter manganicus TaxID=1759059 RepID=A0A1B1AEH5_9PROT|nr:hypothetical protein ATE48_03030 [Candidatus Viadribacter manganicus]